MLPEKDVASHRAVPERHSRPATITVRAGVSEAYASGNIPALRGVDTDGCPGEIVTLIGANGAGKSDADDDDLRRAAVSAKARSPSQDKDISQYLPTYERSRGCNIAQSPGRPRIFRA